MAKLLISTGTDEANLRYASGFSAPDSVVFLQHRDKRFLAVPALEYSRAVKEAKGCEVYSLKELGLEPGKAGIEEWTLALIKKAGVKKVDVSRSFPHAAGVHLQKEGVTVRIKEGDLFPARAVKTDEEVKKITQSQKAAADAVRLATKIISQSEIVLSKRLKWKGKILTSEIVRSEIEKFLLERGYGTFSTIVAGGAQAADPHEEGYGPLPSDKPIILDVFPSSRKNGYFGDITRTVIKSKPDKIQKHMYNTVLKAQKLALSKLKDGVEGKAVHGAVAEYIEQAGYPTELKDGITRGFFHGTGHGVGLEIHEGPSVNLKPGTLRAGNVVTIEPGIYDPDIGGVRIEDTVLITKDGFKMLAPCSKTFQVKKA